MLICLPALIGFRVKLASLRFQSGVHWLRRNFKISILEVNDKCCLFSEALNGYAYFWFCPTRIISNGADSSERNKIPPKSLSFCTAQLVGLHELKQGGSNLRLQFCWLFLHKIVGGPDLLWRVLWTDEATFTNGVNSLRSPHELVSGASLCYSTLFISTRIWC
jgi:hypothetical protein